MESLHAILSKTEHFFCKRGVIVELKLGFSLILESDGKYPRRL